MLMTAGLGTRLRPFTDRMPKPFLPVLDVPVVQYGIDALERGGITRIVANFHHLPEIARQGFARLARGPGVELVLSDESAELLGSSGGLKKAELHFEGQPFFYMNGDVICDVDLSALAQRHAHLRRQFGVSVTLAIFGQGPAGGKYREIRVDYQKGLIQRLGELSEGRPFFTGVAVIEPEAIAHLPANRASEFVPSILEPAIQKQKAGAYLASGAWYDVGSPELWLRAHMSMLEALENKTLPAAWRARVESQCKRVVSGVWVSNEASVSTAPLRWTAPAFYSGPAEHAPDSLGPMSVLYGKSTTPGMQVSGTIEWQGIKG